MASEQNVTTQSSNHSRDWDYSRYLLYNRFAREAQVFDPGQAKRFFDANGGCTDFDRNPDLRNKQHIVTLLGYGEIDSRGNRHTNWFPWNRFLDVFQTIGYECEWTELERLERKGESRIFITWNEPTSLELVNSGVLKSGDCVLQKLTSLGKGMESINWTDDPITWGEDWEWPIYRTVEYLYDLGVNIYAFGCASDQSLFSEKQRISERLADRIFWIPWGGTPYDWQKILAAQPKMEDLVHDAVFVGSKWGKVGRGNVDAWEKYLTPLENADEISFQKFGGLDADMVSDDEMVQFLRTGKLCPIVHAPSWQAERGIQDRFYTVFLAGRFGICDNLGAQDLFGDSISEILAEDPIEYFEKCCYYIHHVEEQERYIRQIQTKIKQKLNFYVSWYDILSALPEFS